MQVLSNGIFFAHFKKFMLERSLVPARLVSFLEELNDFLDMPANKEQLAHARALVAKYLSGSRSVILLPAFTLDSLVASLAADVVPQRDLFAPILSSVLSTLQV